MSESGAGGVHNWRSTVCYWRSREWSFARTYRTIFFLRITVSSPLPHEYRDAWVDLFLRYNTPLPSSASVERLFSYGSDIMRPKRSALSSPNFEKLVFLKGNLKIIKQNLQEAEEEEEIEQHLINTLPRVDWSNSPSPASTPPPAAHAAPPQAARGVPPSVLSRHGCSTVTRKSLQVERDKTLKLDWVYASLLKEERGPNRPSPAAELPDLGPALCADDDRPDDN